MRLRFIGERGDPVPPSLAERMRWADELTADNDLITLFVPFNYSGRAEILRAARDFEGTTEDEFRSGFYAPDMQDPELLIRTGGERRLSNYLLWQVAESELVFSDQLWPDFSRVLLRGGGRGIPPAAPAGDCSRPVSRLPGSSR